MKARRITIALLALGFAAYGCSSKDGDSGGTTTTNTTTSTDDGCLPDIAWYSANASGSAVAPGQKAPNAYGLYDMLGNAVEWPADCYHETYASAPADGSVWDETSCTYRVIRGGCYGSSARDVRVSAREGVEPNFYGACAPGVRCARDAGSGGAGGAGGGGGGATVELTWAQIPGGSFEMGCSADDSGCYDNEKPSHSVTIAAFELTAKEVTQQQYFDQTGESPGSYYCPDCSQTYVTWDKAKAFCEAVGGRLPSEAEWEYAARGGTTTPYYCTTP
jgi:formylglycine-generating enzyme required for sulfatase activity